MILTTKELGEFLGVSVRRVNQMVKEGIAVKTAPGRFDGPASVKNYIQHVSVRLETKSINLDLERERARLAKEQADGHALKNQQLRGDLLPAAEVEAEWSDILRTVRGGVLACTSRIRNRLPHLTTHDAETIDRELRDALAEIGHDQDDANESDEGADPAAAA